MLKTNNRRNLVMCHCSKCNGKDHAVPRPTANRHRFEDLVRTLESVEQLEIGIEKVNKESTSLPIQAHHHHSPGTDAVDDIMESYENAVDAAMMQLSTLFNQIGLAERSFLSSAALVFLSSGSEPFTAHNTTPPLDPTHPANKAILGQRLQLDSLKGALDGIDLVDSPSLQRVEKLLRKMLNRLREKVEGWVYSDWAMQVTRRKNADIMRNQDRPVVHTGA
jgi:hypothetical protein